MHQLIRLQSHTFSCATTQTLSGRAVVPQAVLAEERARAAESMSEIAWDGRRLPVRNNATRLCILNAQDLVKQLAGAGEYAQKEKLFDKLFLQVASPPSHLSRAHMN